MRRLGSELGVEAMALYRYFPSKAALFEAIVDNTVAKIAGAAVDGSDWESAVRAYTRSFRDAARAEPGLFPLLPAAAHTHPGVRALMERMHEMWRKAGLDDETAHQAQCAVHAFTMGTVTAELAASFGSAPQGSTADHRAEESTETEFEFSVNVLVEGLRARVAAREPAQRNDAAPESAGPA